MATLQINGYKADRSTNRFRCFRMSLSVITLPFEEDPLSHLPEQDPHCESRQGENRRTMQRIPESPCEFGLRHRRSSEVKLLHQPC